MGELGSAVPNGVKPNTILCPACRSAPVTGLHLFGLGLEGIEQAVALKKKNIQKSNPVSKNGKAVDMSFLEIQAETSYLLASHSQPGGISSNSELQRTGRWTEEEIAFVDFVLEAYDSGKLPIPHGVKLNELLCDLLLCKSSRLTKKMKNAKLSVRSYKIRSVAGGYPVLDLEMMSTLQDQFLESINQESTRLELRFNMKKMWRSHFSNLCLQVGCNMLDASSWIASLEDMELRGAQAEENIRKARRRRMGEALKADIRAAPQGVFFAGMPVKRPESCQRLNDEEPNTKRVKAEVVASTTGLQSSNGSSGTIGTTVTDFSGASSEEGSEADFIQNMLDMSTDHGNSLHPQESSDYFAIAELFGEFAESESRPIAAEHQPRPYQNVRNNCGPFLDEIVTYMETNNLPFQHADVFVPSYPPTGQGKEGELRLFHAGHVTRSDLDPVNFCQVHEYGEYSVKFSFAPGVGLPGRVFASGEPSWESGIHMADPKVFERAGGAKVYGIKTALGIPLVTSAIGKIVVSMYSTHELEKDPVMMEKIKTDFAKYTPEPKWQLVVDMAGANAAQLSGTVAAAPGTMMHVDHNAVHRERSSSTASTSSNRSEPPEDEEQQIATLLGDYMPLSDAPSSGAPTALVEDFMSLRLMLLRPSTKRSAEENEMLDVIKNSFRGYKRRGDKELAFLIAKDWHYLKATTQSRKPAAQSRDEYQSHVMNSPALNTLSTHGVPSVRPSSLPCMDPSKVTAPSGIAGRQRRVSSSDEDVDPNHPFHGFHIVGEN